MSTNKYNRYLETYAGKDLLKRYKLTEVGLWAVHGEDPNCDLGGHHGEPYLGTVDGTLREAIEIGVEMRSFWQWGGGGSFRLITPIKPQTLLKQKRVEEIDAEVTELNADIARLIEERNKLTA